MKKLTLPKMKNCEISFCVFGNKKILVCKKTGLNFYYALPQNTKIRLNSDLELQTDESDRILKWFNALEKPLRKKLILKGLGLKVSLSENKKFLNFKLGFSHNIFMEIPEIISLVTILKNSIVLESFNPIELGNFANKIRILRKPNIYKGKGIWYKNEKISLKPIKKGK